MSLEHVWPGRGEIAGAQHLDGQPTGFQAVVDALAVEWVHACGGVADQHPVAAPHTPHRAPPRLRGSTQAAAPPTSTQWRPATPDTAPPIGSSADDIARGCPSKPHSSR